MNDFSRLDQILYEFSKNRATNGIDIKFVRLDIRKVIFETLQTPENSEHSLVDVIDDIKKHPDSIIRRDLALFFIRLLAVPELLPENTSSNRLNSRLIQLFECTVPDFFERFKIDKKAQTHEQIRQFQSIDDELYYALSLLAVERSNLADFFSVRQELQKRLKNTHVTSYFKLYGYNQIKESVDGLLVQITEIQKCDDDDTLAHELDHLSEAVSLAITDSEKRIGRLVLQLYRPFLKNIERTLAEHKRKLYERFQCDIKPLFSESDIFEKRYPLHLLDKIIQLTIPFNKSGPGIAANLRVDIGTRDDVQIHSTQIDLGNIKSAVFIVPVSITVMRPLEFLTLDIIIEWRLLGLQESQVKEFSFTIGAQSPDIDWQNLEYSQPYSLDIALGDAFVGRTDTLKRMVARLSGLQMRSFYITGQKRVGKSSLAQALIEYFRNFSNKFEYEFIYLEAGEFKHSEPSKTLAALGHELAFKLAGYLPRSTTWEEPDFTGSLAPLGRLMDFLIRDVPTKRFVLVIDEFDEINPELYRYGSLAETFFLNIRTLSSKPNIAFVLVGGERLTFVMSAQGEKLNKYESEFLNSFQQQAEWKDYEQLIRHPCESQIRWHDNAIRAIYDETNGHPYYTKLICSRVFDNAVQARDAEITQLEILSCLPQLIASLDINMFAHFWKDGIQGDYAEIEIKSLKRCHVLVAYARARRRGERSDLTTLSKYISGRSIDKSEIPALLHEFCMRRIMEEIDNENRIVVKLFESWLLEKGINLIIADQLGEELADAKKQEEENAYVTSLEISNVVKNWSLYQGHPVTTEDIRAWLNQVSSPLDQRRLFTLLTHLKFVSECEVRDYLKKAHGIIQKKLPVVVRTKKSERRKDVLVTYVDGVSKSGSHIANLYAAQNLIATACVLGMGEISSKLETGWENVKLVVITDDFIGTGESLSSNVKKFFEDNGELLEKHKIPVELVTVYGTLEGEERIRRELMELSNNEVDLHIGEILGKENFAFSDGMGFWKDDDEKEKAKALCRELGIKLQPKIPLGYGDQGLLLVFEKNCPNNTLPILHSAGKGEASWHPLFLRRKG
jgi:hypothetical protein